MAFRQRHIRTVKRTERNEEHICNGTKPKRISIKGAKFLSKPIDKSAICNFTPFIFLVRNGQIAFNNSVYTVSELIFQNERRGKN